MPSAVVAVVGEARSRRSISATIRAPAFTRLRRSPSGFQNLSAHGQTVAALRRYAARQQEAQSA